VHPIAFVPVTEYEVVVVGLTVMLGVLFPLFHEYIAAPDAVRVADEPAQILVPESEIVGIGLTVIEIVEVAEQPAAFVPVTV